MPIRRQKGPVGVSIEEMSGEVQRLSEFPPFGSVVEFELEEGATSRKVYHGLNRVPQGWMVVDTNSAVWIYVKPAGGSFNDEYIEFSFSAAVPSTTHVQKMKVWFT